VRNANLVRTLGARRVCAAQIAHACAVAPCHALHDAPWRSSSRERKWTRGLSLVRCAAGEPVLLRPDERRGEGIPWNFGAHAHYLGTFMGPRM